MSGHPKIVRKRSFWRFSAAEVLAHAVILAVISWVIAIALLTLGTTYRDPFDQLKWNDFVHHLNLYDGAVLAAPLISLSGWIEMQSASLSEVRQKWHLAMYALFLFLLLPTARSIGLQLSPFVMLFLMYIVYRIVVRTEVRGTGGEPPLG